MGVFGWWRRVVYRFAKRFEQQSMEFYPVSFAMLSNPGRVRKNNEDTCSAMREHGAFVVCDGMGGAAAGEVASKVAAQTFLKALAPVKGNRDKGPRTPTPDVRMDAAVHAANAAVFQHSRRSIQLHGMGTTLVGLLLEVTGGAREAKKGAAPSSETVSLTLAHVGDSRCYCYRDNALTLLTHDHSLVEEQLRLGEITAFEAEHHPMRNIITRAVGSQATVEPEIRHLEPRSGDLYLLASDGLTRELSDEEIAAILYRAMSKAADGRPNLESLCQTLVDEANDAGGGDNITVLLMQMP
jgi:serine/threonine protein phosphatase PrpC